MTIGSFVTGIGEKVKSAFMAGAKAYLPALLGQRSYGALKTVSPFADLANISYSSPTARPTMIDGAVLDSGLSADPERISVYLDDKTKRALVSLRGTVPTNLSDLKSDVRIATGLGRSDDPYLQNARKTIRDISQQFPDYKIVTAGHSLGGYVARELTKENPNIQGYGFNAGAGLPELLGGANPTNFSSFRQQGDFVSAFDKPSNTGATFKTSIAGSHVISDFITK
jgi:hypothetical protein